MLFCFFTSFLFCKTAKANDVIFNDTIIYIDNSISLNQGCNVVTDKRPNPIFNFIKLKQRKNKRITAAILAFPFPFGIVGLHRIYLGTAPHVPVAYIASLGGIFGILPFIDFCVLVLDKDIERYSENKKVFMWVN